MSQSIDRQTVLQVAKLARIELAEDDVEARQQQMSSVLAYIGKLNEVELPHDIEPFFGGVEAANAIRPDTLHESFSRNSMLKNAPDTDGKFYRVPPVFQ